jgi:hypothetical protein
MESESVSVKAADVSGERSALSGFQIRIWKRTSHERLSFSIKSAFGAAIVVCLQRW